MARKAKTWTMRDGTVIMIKDMTDSHLENCIRMLERNCAALRLEKTYDGFAAMSMLQGEMAIEAVDSEMTMYERMDDSEFLTYTTAYGDLMEELVVNRGIVLEDNTRVGSTKVLSEVTLSMIDKWISRKSFVV